MSFGVLRKLCLALALIMSGVATMGQSIDRSVEIHFRQGSSVYDPNYRGNAERLQKFSDEIVSLHARNYEIVRAEFQAGTSPEGPERVNARLAAERLRNGMSAFLSVIGDDIVLHSDTLAVTSASIGNWESLADVLESGPDFEGRDAAISIMRDSSLAHNAKASALHRLGGGNMELSD